MRACAMRWAASARVPSAAPGAKLAKSAVTRLEGSGAASSATDVPVRRGSGASCCRAGYTPFDERLIGRRPLRKPVSNLTCCIPVPAIERDGRRAASLDDASAPAAPVNGRIARQRTASPRLVVHAQRMTTTRCPRCVCISRSKPPYEGIVASSVQATTRAAAQLRIKRSVKNRRAPRLHSGMCSPWRQRVGVPHALIFRRGQRRACAKRFCVELVSMAL